MVVMLKNLMIPLFCGNQIQSQLPSTPPTLVTAHASCDQPLSVNSGYKLVFKNINKTYDHGLVTALYAVKDRIDYSCFSDQRRSDEVSLYSILPSTEEHFIVHISRLITTHLTFFMNIS